MICIYLMDWKSEAASHEALDVFSQVRFRAGAGAALWWREQVEIRNAIHWNTRMAIQDYFYNKIKSVIKYLAEFIIHMSRSFVLLIIESNVHVWLCWIRGSSLDIWQENPWITALYIRVQTNGENALWVLPWSRMFVCIHPWLRIYIT